MAFEVASAVNQIWTGYKQQREAKKIQAIRPDYGNDLFAGAQANVNAFNSMANGAGVPGQAGIENNLNASVAGGINSLNQTGGSANQILSGVAMLNQNKNSQLTNLGVQGANFRANATSQLAGARNVLDEYKNQQFDYNKNQPYELAYKRKMALQQAGMDNVQGGLNSAAASEQQQQENVMKLGSMAMTAM